MPDIPLMPPMPDIPLMPPMPDIPPMPLMPDIPPMPLMPDIPATAEPAQAKQPASRAACTALEIVVLVIPPLLILVS